MQRQNASVPGTLGCTAILVPQLECTIQLEQQHSGAPGARAAAMMGDREVHSMLELYSFPSVEEERRFKDIVILKPLSDSE